MNKSIRRRGWVHVVRGVYVLPQACLDGVFVECRGARLWVLSVPQYLVDGTERVPFDLFTDWGKARSRNQAMRWAERENYKLYADMLHTSHGVLDSTVTHAEHQEEP
jgi:hypothetical protein